MRVLIVDDEPAARARLHTMLEELDVEVTGEAANGLEALDRVTAQRPDVLLLDIAMPEVDGFDVVRHLPDPRPLVIFQTAFDEHCQRKTIGLQPRLRHKKIHSLAASYPPCGVRRAVSCLDAAARRGLH